jgi:putative oxidoreductase
MKKLQLICRLALGILLIMYGVNGFYDFLNLPPMPREADAVFQNIGYLIIYVKLFEILIGISLVVNVFVPLSLLVLAPISFNILVFHIALYPAGILPGATVALLNAFLLYTYADFYRHFFVPKAKEA